MTANTQLARLSACGCAGPNPIVSSSCSCGGAGCSTCQTQLYVRPQFFAGQLLTEDDLQSLDDYVVAKNRLHNRYLFGSGVVCGLTVTCEPCGGGKVIVNPGYALDCCGNDIVVPCPQTLDINIMVRELQRRSGFDCGDPCPKPSAGSTSPAANAGGRAVVNADSRDVGKLARFPHRYCLYISYCEQLSDPVAPYAVNDPCGNTTCEPTRVREGFRFELRCPEEDDCIPEICKRLWNCIGEPTAAEKTLVDARFLRTYGARLGRATTAIRAAPPPELSNGYWTDLADHSQALRSAIEQLKQEQPSERNRESSVEALLRAIMVLAGDVAQFWIQPERRIPADHRRSLDDAGETLEAGCSAAQETIEQVLTTRLTLVHARALCEVTGHLLAESRRRMEAGQRDRAAALSPIEDHPVRYLARHVVFNRETFAAVAESLAAMRGWAIGQFERQQTGSRCALPRQITAAPLPDRLAAIDVASAETVSHSARLLGEAVSAIVKDCLCNALNPPCPSCDDPAVLLACLTVEDCEVTEICNLERNFVLTGPAIRYWVPELSLLGETLEKWCCPRPHCEPSDEGRESSAEEDEGALFRSNAQPVFGHPVPPLVSVIFSACPPLDRPGKPKLQLPARAGFLHTALDVVSRGAAEPRTDAASGAAAIAHLIETAKTEFDAKLTALSGEIVRLRTENAQLADRIERSQRGGRRSGTQETEP
jgi:hypothetical protein